MAFLHDRANHDDTTYMCAAPRVCVTPHPQPSPEPQEASGNRASQQGKLQLKSCSAAYAKCIQHTKCHACPGTDGVLRCGAAQGNLDGHLLWRGPRRMGRPGWSGLKQADA